jgi:hypothetical protein
MFQITSLKCSSCNAEIVDLLVTGANNLIDSEHQQTSSLNPQRQTIVVDQAQLNCWHQ